MAKKKQQEDSMFPSEEEDLIVSEKDLPPEPEEEQSDSSYVEDDKLVEIETYPGTVAIDYESEGRFSIPERLHWKNWKYDYIHNITLSRPEDRLESIVDALSDMLQDDLGDDFSVQNMTAEEFFETLIAIKMKFQSRYHTHRWICKCQEDLDEDEQQASEAIVDLKSLNYISISQAENNFRNWLKERLSKLSEESLRQYFKNQTKDKSTFDWKNATIDQFVSLISLKEPYSIKSRTQNKLYEFRLGRIKDLIRAKQIATKEFDFKLKEIKRTRWNNQGSLEEFKTRQEKKIKELNEKKGRAIILYSRALTLMRVNGKELSEAERIREYKDIDPEVLQAYVEYLDIIKHGVQDEREYTCNLCGRTDRGSLQQRANLLEFLPIDADSGRNVREHDTAFVYFGI